MNERKIRSITLLSVLLIATVLAVGSVSAAAPDATYAILTVTNAEGDPTINFGFEQEITVSWVADGLIDIEVHEGTIDGPIVTSVSLYDQAATGSTTFTLPSGRYFIVGTGASSESMVCVGSIFVTPESVLGALSAIGACFVAVGVVVIKRKHA